MYLRAPLTLLAVVFLILAGFFLYTQSPWRADPPGLQTASVISPFDTEVNTDEVSVHRIPNPYPTPPLPFQVVEKMTRAALVNIFCKPEHGPMKAISGSGVIIDSRGVVLTSAHVAQYILLSQSPLVDLDCEIRSGSPAATAWRAEVLFIPPIWVELHSKDLTAAEPQATGEHDYALLRITTSSGGDLGRFPYLPIDAREAIGFLGDSVLLAGYPAEFTVPDASSPLLPASSVTTVKELLTFESATVDLMSIGGVVEAQSGSSGGPVVNAWGHLVGLISTTGYGANPSDRDLRAVTLSYINRDIAIQSGLNFEDTLAGDVAEQAANFRLNKATTLVQMLVSELKKSR